MLSSSLCIARPQGPLQESFRRPDQGPNRGTRSVRRTLRAWLDRGHGETDGLAKRGCNKTQTWGTGSDLRVGSLLCLLSWSKSSYALVGTKPLRYLCCIAIYCGSPTHGGWVATPGQGVWESVTKISEVELRMTYSQHPRRLCLDGIDPVQSIKTARALLSRP